MMDHKGATELPGPVKKFYKGEPLALGPSPWGNRIFVVHTATFLVYKGVRQLGPSCQFIISGSLFVAPARNPKPSLEKGMLGMNAMSAVAASIGIVILCISLVYGRWLIRYECTRYYCWQETHIDPLCHENVVIPYVVVVYRNDPSNNVVGLPMAGKDVENP